MRSTCLWMLILASCVAGTAWSADEESVFASGKPEPAGINESSDHGLVLAALAAEAQGDFTTRERLLREAAESGAAAAARAHLGMLDVGVKKPDWKTIDESIAAAGTDSALLRYEQARRQTPDTAAGHLDMAGWCASRKLFDQARAHLTRLLDFVPDHAEARAALGYVRVGDRWVSPGEIRRLQARAAAKARSIERHRKALTPLVGRLKSKNPKDRAAARAALLALRDPSMVGAVEAALGSPDPFISQLAIDWMARVDSAEASLVLARYALLHPDETLRTSAVEKLVNRPLHDFVPELLGMLSSPVTTMIQPNFDGQGRLVGYSQAFCREGMGEKAVHIVERGFQRLIAGGRDLEALMVADAEAESTIVNQSLAEIQSSAEEIQRQNQAIAQVNGRIAAVMARVSGRLLTPDAADMWRWWDEYNETEYQNSKTESIQRSYSVSTVAVAAPESYLPPDPYSTSSIDECFVAGTPVVTRRGLRPIETILAGDMVLNRDLTTGALRWKPVLKATTRQPAATIAITLTDAGGGETFRCSTGHLFWVSGKGWKKASELRANDVVHGAQAPARIAAVEPQPSAPTYNLEVADAPNYFVGRAMLLTHDVTPREANRQAFPGQDHVRHLTDPPPVRATSGR